MYIYIHIHTPVCVRVCLLQSNHLFSLGRGKCETVVQIIKKNCKKEQMTKDFPQCIVISQLASQRKEKVSGK